MSRRWGIHLAFALTVLTLGVMSTPAILRAVGSVFTHLTLFAPANGPIGIDQIVCGGQSGGLVVSVNWPTGSPNNLKIFDAAGNSQNFSSLAGRPTEIKVAAVRNGSGGFTPGDVFVGSGGSGSAGNPAEIVKVSSNGATVEHWATFPPDGLVVGSMFHDRYGVFGGDLIVVLTNDEGPGHGSTNPAGQVWRVTSGGVKTLLVTFTQHLEGVTTIPNFAPEGGGRILVGGSDRIFVIDTAAGVKTIGNVAGAQYPTVRPLRPEDLDVIPNSGTFYGVDFGTGNNDGRILTAPVNAMAGLDFAASAGKILVTTEFPDTVSGFSGLNVLYWDGTRFQYDQVLNTGLIPVHWEHVTFASDLGECAQPAISITKGPERSTITAGHHAAVFTIIVTNKGPGTAQHVEITDPLPSSPGGLVWTTSTPGCTVTGNNLTCSLGNLAASSSVTVTVSAPTRAPENCGTVTNPNAHGSADNALAVDSGPATMTIQCPASLGDFVWNDLNANGIQNSGESGIAGVTVELYNGAGTTLLSTTTTNASGLYLFSNLSPGAYSVKFIKPTGYTFSPQDQPGDDAVDSDANTTTGTTIAVTLAAGQSNLTIDAGMFQPPPPCIGLIGDFVWNDLNSNGIQDSGEPGISGVTVQLKDSGGTIIGTTTTNANGLYQFTARCAGSYTVVIPTPPAGFTATTSNAPGSTTANDSNGSPASVTLPFNNSSDLTIDFGFVQAAAQACLVIIDEDGVDEDMQSVIRASAISGVPQGRLGQFINDPSSGQWDSNYRTQFGWSQYFPPNATCSANGLNTSDTLPTYCGNPPFLWNKLVGAGLSGTPDGSGRLVKMPTGQRSDEGWFAPPPGDPIRFKNGTTMPRAQWMQRFVEGTLPKAYLLETLDVMPVRNQDLIQLVGKTCTAVVYDDDISMNYKHTDSSIDNNYHTIGNLDGDRLGLFTFKIEAVEVPGTLPESVSSSTLYDMWLRILPPAAPITPLVIKLQPDDTDTIQVDKATFNSSSRQLQITATSSFSGNDTTPPYQSDVYNTSTLPTPRTDNDHISYMTVSVDNPTDGGNAFSGTLNDGTAADPLIDPIVRDVPLTYNSSTGKYRLTITVPGAFNLVGEWLVIQTDEGGSYRFQITAP